MFFFVWAIFLIMDAAVLEKIIYSQYNKIADIKMLYFFSRNVGINLLGYWKNGIPNREYRYHFEHLGDPDYCHNRGEFPDNDPRETFDK